MWLWKHCQNKKICMANKKENCFKNKKIDLILNINLFFFWLLFFERIWSSGMTLAFQAKGPGSIPGIRILYDAKPVLRHYATIINHQQ